MAFLIDTDVAIHLRDGDARVASAIAGLDDVVLMSIITRVELEGGVYREPALTAIRRSRLDVLLSAIPTLPFDGNAAEAYRRIVAHAGYSRRKILDRMIAAQAVLHQATLLTRNGGDFADIPDLKVGYL
jgi:tRNA(fMet)-specific endonuclease VapC